MRHLLRPATLTLLILTLAVAVGVLVGSPELSREAGVAKERTTDPVQPVSGLPARQAPSALVDNDSQTSVPANLPASLAGTRQPSGWARTDRHGNLVPSIQLRQLFEYYLSALGEETLAQLVWRIEQALEQLDAPARSQAQAILANYLDYKLALGELETSYGGTSNMGPQEMQRRMAEIQALRRTWLDADTAGAFFDADEAIDRFQLEQLRLSHDDSLSEEEKTQRLTEAEAALPGPIRNARRETRRFEDYERARQALADDPQALAAWREERFDREAAGRLAEAEDRQKDWQKRWQAYSRERQALMSSGLAVPERHEAITELRDRYFEGPEKIRAEALDSIR